MAYQFVREPLRANEADAPSHACKTTEEKLIVWTLFDPGLRVSELCNLRPHHLLWQRSEKDRGSQVHTREEPHR